MLVSQPLSSISARVTPKATVRLGQTLQRVIEPLITWPTPPMVMVPIFFRTKSQQFSMQNFPELAVSSAPPQPQFCVVSGVAVSVVVQIVVSAVLF